MTTNGGVPGAATDGPRSTIKKYGPGVTIKCCVQGCVSMYGDIGVSFHRFPTINTARDVLRRELWVEAAGLPNNNDIIDNSLICGRHFELGKPSLPNEIRAANWTPSLNLKPKVETNFMMSAGETSNIAGIDTSTMMTTVSPKQREVVPILPIMGPQTVPKDLNLPQFCRLCLAEGVQMVFPKDSRVYDQLASKINDNLRLRITVIELTRSLICKKCYETLEQFHQFRTRCTRQDAYLHMRRSLEPERKQPLRYRDNWYWYSCLGNNMNSVIWGCSVVCCPAFIVSHPSGRICAKYANHQHKQKMEDVKTMYCNGEYVFDGYRYSFEMINLNRTLTFNCRSLKDPHGECTAVLITNDRSEVLTVGQHNHEREIIIESAVKDGMDGTKRSITLIRGFDREIVFCQGYWYTTVSEQQSSVSDWSCIREGCTSKIEMVNGTVQYYGTHCHLPVFLKWGAEEDKTIEPKTTTLMKVVNTLPPKPVISPIQQAIPPVALRQSTTIVHSRLPTATAPTSSLTGGIPASTIIKTEPSELQISSVSSCAPEPSSVARPQLNQPLVVSAATMASKATLPMATNKLPTVSVRSNHHIQVVRRTTAPTVRVVPHPRPVPPPTCNTSTIPTQVQTPSTSVAAPQPTVPKILHVMSLNLASKPEPTVLPEIPVSASDPPPSPNWTDLVSEIKEEPQDPLGEDEPETITDEIQPFSGETVMAPPQPTTVAANLPKPPPLTPRPMLLVSSASVTTCNTLDVTALDSDCADSLRPKPPTENVSSPQQTLPPADEDDDGLHDLQDDDEIPPIVPIDADVVSRIIGSEYTTRRLPNGKTQVIRKNILSRGPSALVGTTAKRHVLPTAPPLPTRTGTKTTIRVYGPSPTAPKRVFSYSDEQNDLLTKKSKPTEVTDPPETAIVDVEKSATPEEDDQLDQTAAEDPIAVSIEPHQNLPDDEDSQQENEFSNDEATEAPSTPHENDEDPSPGEESSNDNEAIGESNSPHHNDETSPPQDKSSDDEAVKESSTPPKDDENPEIQNVTATNEQSEAEAPDQQQSQSDKKPSTSRSVQLVKLQRTEQMLSHEGHLYKLKWHNRKRHYWDCMLREQVNCMATLETVSENSQNWRKFLTHNHKVPKPIINEEYRNSYRMLTSETGVPKVKHLPVQTVNISDIKDQSGRMISMIRRKLCAFRIGRIAWGASLHFANYEYRITNAIFPGFRWKCISCQCTIETDEKFTICQDMSYVHTHAPVPDVVDLVDDIKRSQTQLPVLKPVVPAQPKPKQVVPQQNSKESSTPEKPAAEQNDEVSRQENPGEDSSPKEIEETPKDSSNDINQQKEQVEEPSANSATAQENEEIDPIDAMLQEITGDTGQDSLGFLNPSTGNFDGNDSDDDEEMTLDPSSGEMVKKGDLKRKEARKALLEDIVADEDDDELEYLDPLTGEMRRKGDEAAANETEPDPKEKSADQEISGDGPSKDANVSNEDFEELLKKDTSKGLADTKKNRKPKKNSLAALKMVMDVHKRLKIPDKRRNFEALPAPEDSATCLIRFNEFTYELDVAHDSFSIWKCHLSPQYACRGKVNLDDDCVQVTVTGVNHCHVATLEDMFTQLPSEQNGQIMDSDLGSTREYTFYKRPDSVYQLRLDDGHLYNCLTISKTGVSCWRCSDRQAHNCKAMFTMEGKFASLLRNRFSHPHDPVPASSSEAGTESRVDEDEGSGNRSVDSEVKKGSSKRSTRSENDEDRKKQKRQTL